MALFLIIIFNLFLVLFIVFLIALALTLALNPTATLKEIFNHWRKVYKGA